MENKSMKKRIAFVSNELICCGGILTNFEYCQELIKRGYDAAIYANAGNSALQSTYETVPVRRIEDLCEFTDDDVIIANWWHQIYQLEEYRGRKIQFVQGFDLHNYADDQKDLCLKARQNTNWEIIAVSKYAGEWIGRTFTIIPNGISNRFFEDYKQERDIDILVEGSDEVGKNIPETMKIAKSVSDNIAWLTRTDNHQYDVKVFENPPQEEIPKIYQRAKVFLKLSESEGFSLPVLEAMASGCIVITKDMGGNDFCKHIDNCYLAFQQNYLEYSLAKYGEKNKTTDIRENAKQTAKDFTWEKATDNLIKYLNVKL